METRRQRQVGEMIKRHFSVVLQQEGTYVYGVEVLVSITHVLMTSDLGLAKIYLSVWNAEDKQSVILMMTEQNNRLRQLLSQRIKKHVRRIPYIEFYLDETLDEIDRVERLFDDIDDKPKEESKE
ncbi:MAG: ribosome-binding factor A [Saprospiraceae bacterium]|jgi:ribosome-binding factor A